MDERLTEEHYLIAENNGISRKNAYQRFAEYGWEIERAITEPIHQLKNLLWREWKETALKNGVYHELYCARVKKGMTPEEASTTPVKKMGPNKKKSERGRGKYAKLPIA